MALKSKIKEVLYQKHAARAGRHTVKPLRGFIEAIELVQGQNVSVPDPTLLTTLLVDTDKVITAAAGRLYGTWITAGDAAVRVQFTDNGIVTCSVLVPANGFAEAYFYSHTDSIGVTHATDMKVSAKNFPADTAAATTARPTVVAIFGLDSVNTADANLINTNYG